MTLTLTPEIQRMVEDKLKEGGYRSAEEVVRAAMVLLEQYDAAGLDDETLDAIERAEEAIERGEVHKLQDVEEQIRQMFRAK